MRKILFFNCFFFALIILFCSQLKADSWLDPEWNEMIDSSDVIALVQYTSSGKFRAKAKPLKIYRGNLKTDEIWISGFSNRYGPIDEMNQGDTYIVFIKARRLTENVYEYWEGRAKEEPELKEYVDAIVAGKAYYVWSPTSGDLKVKEGKVQYDLLQTTNYGDLKFHSLKEFEVFLAATNGEAKSAFHKGILQKVKKNISHPQLVQYLMMLCLSAYDRYDPIFAKIVDLAHKEANYALAKLLGGIEGEEARDLLVELLDDENSIVQGEAVRQLAHYDAEFVGPILLTRLNTAGTTGMYPADIMNPVRNQIEGGQIQIIKTLGELKYKPAIKALLPLLEVEDDYLFTQLIDGLDQMGSKDYIPYFNKHLEEGHRDLIFTICSVIDDNDLKECVPSLMKFVATHDKSIHSSMEYTISTYMGLGRFPSDTVKSFLYSDFLKVLEMEGGEAIDNKLDWIEEYMEVFAELKMPKVKPLLYDFMFDYYGFNRQFKSNQELFERKRTIEDSISNKIRFITSGDSVQDIKVLAFINSDSNSMILENYVAKVYISSHQEFDEMFAKLDTNGFPQENIVLSTGGYEQTYGAIPINRFGDRIMTNFLTYISAVAESDDILFLKNLKKYGYASTEYDKEKLDEAITELEVRKNIKRQD